MKNEFWSIAPAPVYGNSRLYHQPGLVKDGVVVSYGLKLNGHNLQTHSFSGYTVMKKAPSRQFKMEEPVMKEKLFKNPPH